MRAALGLALVLLLCTPLSSAGTADDPELTDASGDASPPAANLYADGVAAWIEPANDTVLFHLDVARIDSAPPSVAYVLVFDLNGSAYYVVDAGDPTSLERGYFFGEWDREADFPGQESEDITGTMSTGAPASITMALPVDMLDGATSIDELSIRIVDFGSTFVAGAGFVHLDGADGGRALTLAAPSSGESGTAATDAADARTPGAGILAVLALAVVLALGKRFAPPSA